MITSNQVTTNKSLHWPPGVAVTISSRLALLLSLTLIFFGCHRPFENSPPGYVEACFGGIENWEKNWVCSDRRLVVQVYGGEDRWPDLKTMLVDFAVVHSFKVFDTSNSIPDYIRTIEIHVCSNEGMYLSLDKRIYADKFHNRNGDRIEMVFRTYDASLDWKPIADEFVSSVKFNWKEPIHVEWPEPYVGPRALPDSVRSCDE